MVRGAKEDPIDFADRCKSAIARAGGLVDRVWDGNLKVRTVKPQFLKDFKTRVGNALVLKALNLSAGTEN